MIKSELRLISLLFLKESLSPKGGEKMLRQYESMFILSPDLDEETTKSLVEKFSNILSTSATLENLEEIGKKKLAYPIDYKTEGHYVLCHFQSTPEFPKELERQFKITDGVLKYMVIKKD
jgi:small subunit ribosomal protein S6